MGSWFEDIPVLGMLPVDTAIQKLEELGEENAAAMLNASINREPRSNLVIRGSGLQWPFQNRPWQHTSHAFGYVAGGGTHRDRRHETIVHAGNITPDPTLKNNRIKITLAGMRAAEYPGSGSRRVLFDFYAQNQVPGKVEDIHFNATFRIADKAHAAVLGYPLFIGLTAGAGGVFLKCFTVNVGNARDELFLGFLESDAFRAGLKLTTTLQPAIAPLSAMAYNLTKSVAMRHRNVPIQEFYLGLDFATIGIGARLAEGTYVAVQMSETAHALWNWNAWVFDATNGRIVARDNEALSIPYNYIMFTVTRYSDK